MATEILTGLSIFKTLFDTAKGLKDVSDAAVRNVVLVELQEKILAAQQHQAALIERVHELEKEVASFEAWEAEKQRYDLKDIGSGARAYALKVAQGNPEQSHWVCPQCYHDRKISILQPETKSVGRSQHLVCNRCKTDLIVHGVRR